MIEMTFEAEMVGDFDVCLTGACSQFTEELNLIEFKHSMKSYFDYFMKIDAGVELDIVSMEPVLRDPIDRRRIGEFHHVGCLI